MWGGVKWSGVAGMDGVGWGGVGLGPHMGLTIHHKSRTLGPFTAAVIIGSVLGLGDYWEHSLNPTWHDGDVLCHSVLQASHDSRDVGAMPEAVVRVVVPIHRVPGHNPRPCEDAGDILGDCHLTQCGRAHNCRAKRRRFKSRLRCIFGL